MPPLSNPRCVSYTFFSLTKKMLAVFALIILQLSLQMQPAAGQPLKLKKKEVPPEIAEVFQKKYPEAKKIKWSRQGYNYEAIFLFHKHQIRAVYDQQGHWKQHAIRIPMKEAPYQVFMSWFCGFYGDWMPRRIEKIETADALPEYLLEVHQNDMIREIVYDERGNLLRQIIIKQ